MAEKSDFLNAAENMQQQLGPALCLAKWKQVSFHWSTGLNNSCHHPTPNSNKEFAEYLKPTVEKWIQSVKGH